MTLLWSMKFLFRRTLSKGGWRSVQGLHPVLCSDFFHSHPQLCILCIVGCSGEMLQDVCDQTWFIIREFWTSKSLFPTISTTIIGSHCYVILGQNANTQNPNPKTPTSKHKNQWHFIYWRFVRGIMTGYPVMFPRSVVCYNYKVNKVSKYGSGLVPITSSFFINYYLICMKSDLATLHPFWVTLT